MDGCRPADDDAFGPVVSHCRHGFDFTLLFEQGILSLLPSVLVLVASAYRLLVYYRHSSKSIITPSVSWVTAKQTTIIAFTISQLVLTILWAIPGHEATRLSVAASAVSFFSGLVFSRLSYVEHNRSTRPSGILTSYLIFSILFDVAQARTLWLRDNNTAICVVFTIGIALKVGILCVEMMGKRSILQSPYRNWSPEVLGGIVNRSMFWWINDLLRNGSRTILKQPDLYPLDPGLQSVHLRSKLKDAWERSSKKGSHSLLLATMLCFWKPMMAVAVPRIALSAFKICQPLLIERAVSLLAEPESQRKTDVGRAMIGATALVYIGIAICTAQYRHRTYRYITMMRGALVALIYDKTLDLNLGAVNDGAAMTLMSTDIERIAVGFEWTDALWAGPLEIAISTYILYTQIGYSCFAPLILASMFVAIWGALGSVSARYQTGWMEAVQRRVAATANVLGNMKGIKGSGLSNVFGEELQRLRVEELQVSGKFRQILALFSVLGNFSGASIPILTLIVYMLVIRATTGVQLDPSVAFTSISLVTLLGAPIQQFAVALLHLAAATGCFQRIQEYLLSTEERHEHLPASRSGSGSNDGIELQDLKFGLPGSSQKSNILRVQDATFSFTPDGPPILSDLSLALPGGSWTVVIGPVGCGKSALLLALLDEMYATKGFVYSRPSIQTGFCAQEAWLPNLSIRSIILGPSDFDEGLYSTVVRACALHQDLQVLPKGDESVVGSKGTSLSGGQKQRIGLARALYARPQLLLLDDVLSGLDSATERHVVNNVFGPQGICRRNGTTVLLATHSARIAREADQAIVLAPGGTILKQGPPTSLDLVGSDGDSEDSSDSAATEVEDAVNVAQSAPPAEPEDTNKQQAEQDLSRKTGDIRLYSYYFRMLGWPVTVALMASCAIFSFSAKFPTLWLKWWSDAETKSPGEHTTMYMTVYGMFCVICLLFLFVGVWTLAMVGIPRSSNKLHCILVQSVMAAPYWFFVSTDSGQTLNRFSQDMSLIDMSLPVSLVDFTFAVFLCIISAVLIAWGSKWTALMYPPLFVTLYVLQMFYLKTSRQMRFLDLEAKSPLYSHFLETLQGLSTIRAFGWQQSVRTQHHQILDSSQQPFYLMYSIQRWLNLVLDTLVAVVATFIMALATQLKGSTASDLGVSLANILSFSSTMALLISVWAELETSLGAVSRVRAFVKTTPSEHLAEESIEPPPEWPLKGELLFSNFSGSYKLDSETVLRNVSLRIEPGQKVGLCGRTGSGKTSFILSILRLVEATEGDIFLDGLSLSKIPRTRVRQGVTAIPQEPLIHRGTARFNADPFSRHSDEEIISALKEVNIWKVLADRGGLDADMETVALSRGEQQLFCLSRAVLAKPRVLILDEVTSSVDREQEDEVVKMLHRNFTNTTILMVVHHLRMVREFDKILVLSKGEIVEQGHPDALMAQDSVFRELFTAQQDTSERE